jgi:hypothetical protein
MVDEDPPGSGGLGQPRFLQLPLAPGPGRVGVAQVEGQTGGDPGGGEGDGKVVGDVSLMPGRLELSQALGEPAAGDEVAPALAGGVAAEAIVAKADGDVHRPLSSGQAVVGPDSPVGGHGHPVADVAEGAALQGLGDNGLGRPLVGEGPRDVHGAVGVAGNVAAEPGVHLGHTVGLAELLPPCGGP